MAAGAIEGEGNSYETLNRSYRMSNGGLSFKLIDVSWGMTVVVLIQWAVTKSILVIPIIPSVTGF